MNTRTKIYKTKLDSYVESGYQFKHDSPKDYTVQSQIVGLEVYHIVTYYDYE